MAEAAGTAVFAVVVAFLCVFALDRLADTPRWLRWASCWARCAAAPSCRCTCTIGSGDAAAWSNSPGCSARSSRGWATSCWASSSWFTARASKRDRGLFVRPPFGRWPTTPRSATSTTRRRILGIARGESRRRRCRGGHRSWPCCVPPAAVNAWERFLAPWADTPRYTFAAVEPLPAEIVVAHGEPFRVAVRLARARSGVRRKAEIRVGRQEPITAPLQDDRYEFDLPPQIAAGRLEVRIGDARQTVRLKPLLRPELTSIVAEVSLPEYLGRPEQLKKDVRGGSVSLVKGSRAVLPPRPAASCRRPGWTAGRRNPSSATIRSPEVLVKDAARGQVPVGGRIRASGQGAVHVEGQRVRRRSPQPGLRGLAARQSRARFGAIALPRQGRRRFRRQTDRHASGRRPRARSSRLPSRANASWRRADARRRRSKRGRRSRRNRWESNRSRFTCASTRRTISPAASASTRPTALLYVLDPEQHAIWLTEQLSRWHRQSLEVRDHEMRLHETNKQLRGLPPEELDRPATRRRIEQQAAAERANGRRLERPGRGRRRPAPPGVPQSGVRRRPSGSLGRDAADSQGHRGQSHAVGGGSAEAGLRGEAAVAGKPSNTGPKAGAGTRVGLRQSGESPAKDKKQPPKIPADRRRRIDASNRQTRIRPARARASPPARPVCGCPPRR